MVGEVGVNGCGGLGECGELIPGAGDDFRRLSSSVQACGSGSVSALKLDPERDTEPGFRAIHFNLVDLVSVTGFGEEFEAGGDGIGDELAVGIAGGDPGTSGNDTTALRPVEGLKGAGLDFDMNLSASGKSESSLMNTGVDTDALGGMGRGGCQLKFVESEGVIVVSFTVESKSADGSGSGEDWGKSLSNNEGISG